ncbi:MAG TPA: archaeal proteasome endopeptidase complex subunit beta [archaeon]|nr:archaeal proteasome endopeptidase complex subunit beta [archaeon]
MTEVQMQLKSGTTTVALICKDAVVMAADRKATMGYLIASKDVLKVRQLDEHIAMTIAGVVGDAQALERYIMAELKLFKLHEDRKMPVKNAASLVSNILYARRFYPYYVQLIVAGYDATGPSIYTLAPDGSIIPEKYYSTGSGSPMVFGVLENEYKDNMELEDAKRLAVRAVSAAVKRDIASGGSGVDLFVIDKKGVRKISDSEVEKLAK